MTTLVLSWVMVITWLVKASSPGYTMWKDWAIICFLSVNFVIPILKLHSENIHAMFKIRMLWHRRLNHLKFGTINDLARKDLVRGLPRLKFEKYHLCSACQLGKSKKHTHKPKAENTNLEVLNTLHMDLCGLMRVQTINGKKYILVIVDDYSRFTWVKFFRSKDGTPEVVIKFITQIQVVLNKTIRYFPELLNKTVLSKEKSYSCRSCSDYADLFQSFDVPMGRSCGYCVLHPKPFPNSHSPPQDSYELVHNKKPDLTFFRVFGALCYHINDSKDLRKIQPTADTGIFVLVSSAGTPLSTTIDQDAPSPHNSPSSSALQSYSLPPGVVAEPHFMEDHNVAPVDNNPFVNVFALEEPRT
nr:hypothetical protein [Tanacetum cinerariifolium]